MPSPVFAICSSSASVDETTNELSLFQVIDGFQVHIAKGPKKPTVDLDQRMMVRQNSFVGVAVWRADDDDLGEEFDVEILFQSPGGEEAVNKQGTFRFEKKLQRIQTHILMAKPWTTSGEFIFACRIRKTGSDEWLRQEYRIPIAVTVHEEQGDNGAKD